jgi:putative tryptophan/tyrosine transport system substrate-binding protein
MRRRTFITLLGGAAAVPLAARAQQREMPVVGLLSPGSPDTRRVQLAAIRRGLTETGYVEGRNYAMEYRWWGDQQNRLPALAAELVGLRPAVIVAPSGAAGGLAAKAATTTIPIVFEMGVDPVALGLVPSLNRPGGNVTGITSLNVEVGPKRLELLREIAPRARALALLVDPTNVGSEQLLHESHAAARTLGVDLHVINARTPAEIDAAFATLPSLGAGGLVVAPAPLFASRTQQLVELVFSHAMPAVYFNRELVVAGGLMSYGGNIADTHRLAGVYAGRILKGEKPADLPVQQATRIELIINMKTAKALGLTFPITLLGRADEVIE